MFDPTKGLRSQHHNHNARGIRASTILARALPLASSTAHNCSDVHQGARWTRPIVDCSHYAHPSRSRHARQLRCPIDFFRGDPGGTTKTNSEGLLFPAQATVADHKRAIPPSQWRQSLEGSLALSSRNGAFMFISSWGQCGGVFQVAKTEIQAVPKQEPP